MQFALKVVLSALIIAGVSEVAKRLPWIAAILAALPLTSMLAMIWLYRDTGDVEKVVALSWGIFWAVLPTLLFFVVLPWLLHKGVRFNWAMLGASGVLVLGYALYLGILSKLGIRIT